MCHPKAQGRRVEDRPYPPYPGTPPTTGTPGLPTQVDGEPGDLLAMSKSYGASLGPRVSSFILRPSLESARRTAIPEP